MKGKGVPRPSERARACVLAVFLEAGGAGATEHEVHCKSGLALNAVARACAALRRLGHLADGGARRPAPAVPGVVWVLASRRAARPPVRRMRDRLPLVLRCIVERGATGATVLDIGRETGFPPGAVCWCFDRLRLLGRIVATAFERRQDAGNGAGKSRRLVWVATGCEDCGKEGAA